MNIIVIILYNWHIAHDCVKLYTIRTSGTLYNISLQIVLVFTSIAQGKLVLLHTTCTVVKHNKLVTDAVYHS